MEEEISTEKTRHGCLTAYLGFMILVNSAMALVYILAGGSIASAGDLRSTVIDLGLQVVCWVPLYDAGLPIVLIARMRPALRPYNAQDLMTTGLFCVLDKPQAGA